MKKKKSGTLIIVIAVIAVVVVAAAVIGVGAYKKALYGEKLTAGDALLEAGQYEDAVAMYNEAISLTKDNGGAYYGLAQAQFALENYDYAEQVAEFGLESTGAPELEAYLAFLKEEARTRRYHALMAEADEALAAQDYGKAAEGYGEALTLKTEYSAPYYGLAQAYFALEKYEDAQKTAAQGFEATGGAELEEYLDFLANEALRRRYNELPTEDRTALEGFLDRITRFYFNLGYDDQLIEAMRGEITSILLFHEEHGSWDVEPTRDDGEGNMEEYAEQMELDGKTYYYDLEHVYLEALLNHRTPEKGHITYYYTGEIYEPGELDHLDQHLSAYFSEEENGYLRPLYFFLYNAPVNFMDGCVISRIENDFFKDKFDNFLTLKDYNSPELTTRGQREMAEKFPNIEYLPIYIVDPKIKLREIRDLNNIISSNCETKPYELTVEEELFTFALREYFPNLETIEYICDHDTAK